MNTQPGVRQKSQRPLTHRNIMHPIVIDIQTASRPVKIGRVLCIGIQREDTAPDFLCDESESVLLRRFWLELESRASDEVFVTFKGHRSVFPCLLRRSFVMDVTVPGWFPRDGHYPLQAFTDVAEAWQCGDPAVVISLNRLAHLCGLPASIHSGTDFTQLWEVKRPTALARFANDLQLIRQLWQRIIVR